MTLSEIKTLLEKAAAEDMMLARREGMMVITDTSIGNITLEYKGGAYFAHSEDRPTYASNVGNEIDMLNWLMGRYDIILEGELKRKES